MNLDILKTLTFSPTGTTRKIAQAMSEAFRDSVGGSVVEHDLLRNPLNENLLCAANELTVVGMPVYSGRIPDVSLSGLSRLKGQGGPAVAFVVYGNRAYEDALLELQTLLTSNGFIVAAAAALVARHSIFPNVATDRPDVDDLQQAGDFMRSVLSRLADMDALADINLAVPGNSPYREPTPARMFPEVDEHCTLCGACVRLCPTKALSVTNGTLLKDVARCIACAACIRVCPDNAQAFRGAAYEATAGMFAEKFGVTRQEPEFFVCR